MNLEELKRENERLKNIQKGLKEMEDIQSDRLKLARENKKLLRSIKHKDKIKFGKVVKKGLFKVGKTTGIAGKQVFRGLKKYADYLERQERKQKCLNKSLKSIKKKKRK